LRKPLERFSRPLELATARGRMRAEVRIFEWVIDPRAKIEALPLPARGLTIVLVRSNEMTTVINGRRERRVEGTNFTVPVDVPIGIETGDDAVGFDLIVIEQPNPR
jgi:hypothetical protein